MIEVFSYRVTPKEEGLESTLSKSVFPKVSIRKRNAQGVRHKLQELGPRNGHTEYLWTIYSEYGGGIPPGPPALAELQEAMGSLGTVDGPLEAGPFASVTIDLTRPPDQGQAIIRPNLVKVPLKGSIVWSFFDVPPGYKPHVEFVGFRPLLGKLDQSRHDSPFEEHSVGPQRVTGARAVGAKGHYWYKIALVPEPVMGTEVLRLECAEESWFDPQLDVHGAGVEVEDPPASK